SCIILYKYCAHTEFFSEFEVASATMLCYYCKKLFMKNLYLLAAALFCSTISAQNKISFETSEGYQLGSINGQNSWQITDDGDGNFVENQLVSAEKFTSGIYSFKNGYT